MVSIRIKTKYGGINEYKANTYGFSRILRSIFAVLERLCENEQVTPEGALALVMQELPLQPSFTPVDDYVRVDMRHDDASLQAFLAKTSIGKHLYITRVMEVLLRLDTRDGLEALDAFELAAIKVQRSLASLSGQTVKKPPEVTEEAKDVKPKDTQSQTVKPKDTPSQTEKPKDTPSQTVKKSIEKKAKKPTTKKAIKGTKVTPTQTTPSSYTKLDDALARGRAAIQRSRETLAESGQTVATNPLLNDFLS